MKKRPSMKKNETKHGSKLSASSLWTTKRLVLSGLKSLVASGLIFIFSPATEAACFDPAVAAGFAAKDSLTQSLVVIQPAIGGKDSIAGVAVKGTYYGCRASAKMIATQSNAAKKFSIFLPLKRASIQGFELDTSSATQRILAARAIQVPWDVVDKSTGVTAVCSLSTMTAFEGFLYAALKNTGARRCTQLEIEELVGRPPNSRR